jgi:RNA polymerase sigma-70 factor (ECF subfamily)
LATRDALAKAFATLPPEQRAAVALHLHLGYTVQETADLVGVPIETVRSRLRLARERLRRSLEADE